MRFFGGQRGTKTTMFLGFMSDHCERNFRPEMRKIIIEGSKTESLPWFG